MNTSYSLTLSVHALEGYSSHFYLSVCLSVCLSVADLEDGRLLALRDMSLNWITIYVPLICHTLLKFGLVLEKKYKNYAVQAP